MYERLTSRDRPSADASHRLAAGDEDEHKVRLLRKMLAISHTFGSYSTCDLRSGREAREHGPDAQPVQTLRANCESAEHANRRREVWREEASTRA